MFIIKKQMRKYIVIFLTLIIALVVTTFFIPRKSEAPIPTPSPTGEINITEKKVQLFFIALEDNGARGEEIGCNDTLVPVEYTISSQDPVRTTLEYILSLKTQTYEETDLYNSLYQSTLTVKDIKESNNSINVYLEGQIQLGGVCDHPRLQEQLERTLTQFYPGKKVNVFINNKEIADLLSQQ